MDGPEERSRPLLRLAVLAAFILTGIVAVYLGGQGSALAGGVEAAGEAAATWVAAHPVLAALGYALVYMVLVSVTLPGAFWFTLGGGFLLGFYWAVPVSLIGLTGGAVLSLLMLRFLVGETRQARLRQRVERFAAGFRKNDLSYLIVLRLVPLPFFLVNLAAALLGASLVRFVVATMIGSIPSTIVYSGLGSGLAVLLEEGRGPGWRDFTHPVFLVTALMVLFIALAPVWLRRRRGQAEVVALSENPH
ncbi:TVP38/TMEM64 family protein [Maricaulis sp. CAU 1757]